MTKNIRNSIPEENTRCFTSHMGLYAMEPNHLVSALGMIQAGIDIELSAAEVEKRSKTYLEYSVIEGVAIVPITGSLTKRPSKYGGTSTVNARKIIRDAVSSKDVESLMLYVDSPGGQVRGTTELADEIRKASESKEVHAYIDDLGASAAYWAASQASRITMNKAGEVGSIGTLMLLYDMSESYAKDGIKPILIATGEYKGLGVPGVEVTESQIEYLQGKAEYTQKQFLEAVASGRGMSVENVKKLADGKTYNSEEALAYGLIDSVSTYEDALAALIGVSQEDKNTLRLRAETVQREIDLM